MGLEIFVAKTDSMAHVALKNRLSFLCEKIIEKEDHLVCVPLRGKLMEVVGILTHDDVSYLIRRDSD